MRANVGVMKKRTKLKGNYNPTELPIFKIKGKFYFYDKRLNEYRNIKNVDDRLNYSNVTLSQIQKPTLKDRKKIFGGR